MTGEAITLSFVVSLELRLTVAEGSCIDLADAL